MHVFQETMRDEAGKLNQLMILSKCHQQRIVLSSQGTPED